MFCHVCLRALNKGMHVCIVICSLISGEIYFEKSGGKKQKKYSEKQNKNIPKNWKKNFHKKQTNKQNINLKNTNEQKIFLKKAPQKYTQKTGK